MPFIIAQLTCLLLLVVITTCDTLGIVEILLKPKDVATRLNISLSAVYVLVKSGKLDGIKLSAKTLRITAESVRRLLGRTC